MKNHVHIIGGGIIGLCSAWYLRQAGFDVTIIEKNSTKNGTSSGNAGMIVPSHFVPLAAPGVISQGLRWILNPKSPFFIRPRANLDLIRWMWDFYRNCNPENVQRSAAFLRDYNELSRDLYGAFAQNKNFNFAFERKGLLMLYKSEKMAEEEHLHAEKALKLGISTAFYDREQLGTLEPNIKIDALGGILYPDDAHLYPNLFLEQMSKELKKMGVKILDNTTVIELQTSSHSIDSFTDQHSEKHNIDKVLFSTGSWTAQILKQVGISILLQDGKGYSITIKNPVIKPSIPTILAEAKVAVTPMGDDLRIGGTLEISGLSDRINMNRVQGISEAMTQYYPQIKLETQQKKNIWHGFRPCTTDGLPYLGKLDQYANGFIATGHGMMGMSLGPATGKIISEIIQEKEPSIDINLLRKA